MAKYKPGKSGVASRKIRNLKKDIKSESDKDRIKELEEKLAILMAKQNQATEGGKSVSDADLERAKQSRKFYGMAPTDAPEGFFMTDEEMAELRAGASQRDLEQGISRRKTLKRTPLKKGGGKIYTSMNKKYGGGIFPRKGNI